MYNQNKFIETCKTYTLKVIIINICITLRYSSPYIAIKSSKY